MKRLAAPYGSLIDREQPIDFSFENKSYQGFAGDSIASALAANEQWLLSRSFKISSPTGSTNHGRPGCQYHGPVTLQPQCSGRP